MCTENRQNQYGVIHETGDLGLGFDILEDKKDQEALKKDEEKRRRESNKRSGYRIKSSEGMI